MLINKRDYNRDLLYFCLHKKYAAKNEQENVQPANQSTSAKFDLERFKKWKDVQDRKIKRIKSKANVIASENQTD